MPRHLATFSNVAYQLVDGNGSLGGIADGEVDVVFSYITFQHVPTGAAQLRYFDECARVLRDGGKLAVQIRSSAPVAVALSYAGYFVHVAEGRRTLHRSWRGSRVKASAVVARLRACGVTATVPFLAAPCPLEPDATVGGRHERLKRASTSDLATVMLRRGRCDAARWRRTVPRGSQVRRGT